MDPVSLVMDGEILDTEYHVTVTWSYVMHYKYPVFMDTINFSQASPVKTSDNTTPSSTLQRW